MRRLALMCAAWAAVVHASVCEAQEPLHSDFETWSDIRTVYNFTNTFAYDGDQGYRTVVSSDDWSLMYLRPSVQYKWTSFLAVRGGVALFYLFQNVDSAEFRLWEGLQLFWPKLSELTFDQYVRLEQRFLSIQRTEHQFVHRFRYRIRVRTRPRPVLGIPTPSDAMLGYEVFVYLDDSVWTSQLKEDRLYAGVGNEVSSKWTVRLEYIRQRLEWSGYAGLARADNILRIRLTCVIH
jgi:hypothetical protein